MKLEVALVGRRSAGCRGCGRVFTSVSAFDKHQRVPRDVKGVVCLDPASVGLERKPSGVWGRKMDERHSARLVRFDGGRKANRPSETASSIVGWVA